MGKYFFNDAWAGRFILGITHQVTVCHRIHVEHFDECKFSVDVNGLVHEGMIDRKKFAEIFQARSSQVM